MIAAIRAAPEGEITLCALGPLTNLAMALRLAPDIAPRIAEIVLMGGALALGNMTPAAEFNMYVDPHAAAIVLGAGIGITMFGLQVTHQALASPAQMARLAALDTPVGRSVQGMLSRPRPGGLGTAAHPMHDPCVIAWLLWPELFTGRDCHVTVQTEGELRGRTTIDWNNRLRRPANAFVPDKVDAASLFDRMIDALTPLHGPAPA
jgi:purine nucleosidase